MIWVALVLVFYHSSRNLTKTASSESNSRAQEHLDFNSQPQIPVSLSISATQEPAVMKASQGLYRAKVTEKVVSLECAGINLGRR